MKGYSDQMLYLEEQKENMALLENGDLGQIVAFLKIQIAGVGHVSGRVAVLECQASNQHFGWLCQGDGRKPSVGTLTHHATVGACIIHYLH